MRHYQIYSEAKETTKKNPSCVTKSPGANLTLRSDAYAMPAPTKTRLAIRTLGVYDRLVAFLMALPSRQSAVAAFAIAARLRALCVHCTWNCMRAKGVFVGVVINDCSRHCFCCWCVVVVVLLVWHGVLRCGVVVCGVVLFRCVVLRCVVLLFVVVRHSDRHSQSPSADPSTSVRRLPIQPVIPPVAWSSTQSSRQRHSHALYTAVTLTTKLPHHLLHSLSLGECG